MESSESGVDKSLILAFVLALLGNVLAILNVGTIWFEAPGTSFRPMQLPVFAMTIAVATAGAVVMLIAMVFWPRERIRLSEIAIALVSVVLAQLPLPLTIILTHWVMVAHQLIFEP